MKLYIADAFTEQLFGGNPAGVVILGENEDFPSDEVMRKTAAELRYSETAFIKQLAKRRFKIRYFTPADEVDLCGHATIASFFCLMDAGLAKDGEDYIDETLAGDLTIKIQNGFVMMEMAPPEHIDTIIKKEAINELYEIMGLEYKPTLYRESCCDVITLLPRLISTGLPDIIMPVPTVAQLNAIAPDFPKLTELSRRYEAVGVHAFALEMNDREITAHCRNFAPLYDIDEEAATGTSSGALTYYLNQYGIVPGGRESVFLQGEAMDRPSKIYTHIDTSDPKNIQIQVGGNAVILAKGEIYL